jgi:hypothetical protein
VFSRFRTLMETMLVETMHVWKAPGKGLSCKECVVIKSSALLLSNSCLVRFGLYSSSVGIETVLLTQWLAFRQSYGSDWSKEKKGIVERAVPSWIVTPFVFPPPRVHLYRLMACLSPL